MIILNANIIALSNQKGGVGKTTTTVNLGVGLANAGEKVLLVDCDPQASLTISLGYPQPDKLPCTLSTLMGSVITDEPISKLNDIPLCSDFDDLRRYKLSRMIYPRDVLLLCALFHNDDAKRQAEEDAIPEFRQYNIIEGDIRNVV